MKTKYTAAFISITLSGEIFIITQFKGTEQECRNWTDERQEYYLDHFGKVLTLIMENPKTA